MNRAYARLFLQKERVSLVANEKILVVDDDTNICELLRLYLEKEGYAVKSVNDGVSAINAFKQENPDLMILDIMLPKLDGWQVCREVRKFSDKPIIMLTAKGETFDKVLGLELGADDYMTKPFGSMELIARVHACLRRYEQILSLRQEKEDDGVLHVGALELNTLSKQAKVNGHTLSLRPKEYQILALLMAHPGQVYSAQQIYEAIWKEEAINTETIMVHIRKLREKIEADPKRPQYLKVVWGIGYKIEKDR